MSGQPTTQPMAIPARERPTAPLELGSDTPAGWDGAPAAGVGPASGAAGGGLAAASGAAPSGGSAPSGQQDKPPDGRTPSPSPPFPPFSPPTHSLGATGARSLELSPMRWIPKRTAVRAQRAGTSLLSDSLTGAKKPAEDATAGGGGGGGGGETDDTVAVTAASPADGGRTLLSRQMSSSYPPGGRTLTGPSFGRAGRGGGGGARGGGGGRGGGDWRKSFVLAATTANKKAEYLHGSQCRETRELNDVLAEAVLALERGIKPDLTEDGLGGTYFVKSRTGKSIAVFKPRDEEPLAVNNPKAHAGDGRGEGLNEGVNVGEAAMNEYAAYLLDQASPSDGALRAGVCPTALVRMAHSTFHAADEDRSAPFKQIKDKVGSFQLFAQHDCTAEDIGSSKFLPEHVHPIAVLDIRLCNTDRHPGNILVRESPSGGGDVSGLVPIDHGYALPSEVGSAEFEWLHWPAAKVPFSEAARAEILAIDVAGVDAMLRRRMTGLLRSACLQTLALCTTLLQRGVAAGLTAHEIGALMMRPYCRRDEGETQPSQLERLVTEAKLQCDSTEPLLECFARLASAKCKRVATATTAAAAAAAAGAGAAGAGAAR
jgi:hypothetical protein